MPFRVTDTNDRKVAVFCENENREVFDDMKDCLGGISGSPAYSRSDCGELSLIGFATLGSSESDSPNKKYRAEPGSP